MTKSNLLSRLGINPTADAPNEYASTFLQGSEMSLIALERRNKALAKFLNDAQGHFSASLAETLAEWKQAEEMIVNRASQLLGLARAIRRADWQGIRVHLRRTGTLFDRSDPKAWRKAREVVQSSKNFGERWLEFHLGWEPLLSDIHNSLLILYGTLPSGRVRARSSTEDTRRVLQEFPTHKNDKHVHFRVGVLVQALCYLVNPNSALLHQLGLDNPLKIAWELVPYSFVVDWFWDVSGYLTSFEGVPGCIILDAFYTTFKWGCSQEDDLTRSSSSKPWDLNRSCGAESVIVNRVLGLPPYHFLPPSIPRWSPTRAITAIALLLKGLHP
jgi:hypothetical protein